MGSLTFQRAWARFQTALEQRLDTAELPADQRAVYQDAIDKLVRIAIDEEELNRVARELAVDPDIIPFLDCTSIALRQCWWYPPVQP